jgi:hypothetical protein
MAGKIECILLVKTDDGKKSARKNAGDLHSRPFAPRVREWKADKCHEFKPEKQIIYTAYLLFLIPLVI